MFNQKAKLITKLNEENRWLDSTYQHLSAANARLDERISDLEQLLINLAWFHQPTYPKLANDTDASFLGGAQLNMECLTCHVKYPCDELIDLRWLYDTLCGIPKVRGQVEQESAKLIWSPGLKGDVDEDQ